MFLDRTFLSGLIVTALGFILPVVLGLAGWEIPIDFLNDGIITWRELVRFAGLILMAWSDTGQVQLRQVFQSQAKAKIYHLSVTKKRRAA